MAPLPFVLAAAGLAGIGAWMLGRQARKRRVRSADLRALADELGFEFRAAPDVRHRDHYAVFDAFRRGVGGMARDTLWGSFSIGGTGFPAKAGDFLQTRPADHLQRDGVSRRFSYLILHFPFADARTLFVEPTRGRAAPRPGEPLGDGELDFERGDFLRDYTFSCSDRELPARLFDAEVQALLLATRSTVEVMAGRLCLSDGERSWTPDEFRAQMRVAGEIAQRWPRE